MTFDELLDEFEVWDDEEPEPPFTDGPLKGKVVGVDRYGGVAWYVEADDGDAWVTAIMVGDDREFVHDRSDVHEIAREAYCGECGQIGCQHDGLDRE